MKHLNFKIFAILYGIMVVLLTILMGYEKYHGLEKNNFALWFDLTMFIVTCCMWLYHTENVPDGGIWITLNEQYFKVGDEIYIGDEEMLSTIYKIKKESDSVMIYAIPNYEGNPYSNY